MPLYLITKSITAYLTVNCDNLEQALNWSERVVATLEDVDGNPIAPNEIEDFEASSNPSEIEIELVEDIDSIE
jgi:hypothetical protein